MFGLASSKKVDALNDLLAEYMRRVARLEGDLFDARDAATMWRLKYEDVTRDGVFPGPTKVKPTSPTCAAVGGQDLPAGNSPYQPVPMPRGKDAEALHAKSANEAVQHLMAAGRDDNGALPTPEEDQGDAKLPLVAAVLFSQLPAGTQARFGKPYRRPIRNYRPNDFDTIKLLPKPKAHPRGRK